MAVEFKDRDMLKAIKKDLQKDKQPRAKLAQRETRDEAKVRVLKSEINNLAAKKAKANGRLSIAVQIADPLLEKASKVYERAHQVQGEYESALAEAKDEMQTGAADIAKAEKMKRDFYAQEQPVERAQVKADDADEKYRADALRFAAAMLRAEKAGKNPKLRKEAGKNLAKLRAQLSADSSLRKSAMKSLEASQSSMHVQGGLQNYNRWKLRGENLINKGKTVLKQGEEIKEEWKNWSGPLKAAQERAAKAETKVHQLRMKEEKIAKALSSKQRLSAKLSKDEKVAQTQLTHLEQSDVALRQKGLKLMSQFHSLKADVEKRERERAKKTAKMAADNAEAMKELLDQE